MTVKNIRIGIFGAAGIAPRALIAPAKLRDDVVLAAVASRRREAGEAYAKEHGIERVFGSYDEMLADPDIDLVYNALPPAGHAEWSIKALEAGKHVLCEKPFALNTAEAEAMVAAGEKSGLVLAEAFHDRYHPVFLHLLDLKPRLGAIKSLNAEFLVNIPYDPKDIRYDPEPGGGAMMDLGVYPLHWLRCFMGSEPEVLSATTDLCELGTDTRMAGELMFDGSARATFKADMQNGEGPFVCVMKVEGENGTVEIKNPCLPHIGHSFSENINGREAQYTIAGGTTYDYQLAAVLDAIREGKPLLTGGEDAINNMRAVDRIYRKAGVKRTERAERGAAE